jgi:hypothetical protein
MKMYISTSKVLLRTVAAAVFGATTACAFSAHAGECPADKRMPNARQPVDFKAVGVTDTTLGSIDLGKEQAKIAGRELRFRKLVIEPGGIVPWHSHDDRPALIYVAEARSRNMPATVLPQSCTRLAKYGQKHRVRHTGGRISAIKRWFCLSATFAATQKITICDG